MLSQEYRPVATSTGPLAPIHALLGQNDKTMCGTVDVLDTVTMIGRVVNCGDCLKALKKERQRRSHQGQIDAQRRRDADANADADWRATRDAGQRECDADLIEMMQARAVAFMESGDNAMGAILANTANIMQKNLDQ